MIKRFDIHVKYTQGTPTMVEYHLTNWGSNLADRAIKNAHSIMKVFDADGTFRFAGVMVYEGEKCIYKLER